MGNSTGPENFPSENRLTATRKSNKLAVRQPQTTHTLWVSHSHTVVACSPFCFGPISQWNLHTVTWENWPLSTYHTHLPWNVNCWQERLVCYTTIAKLFANGLYILCCELAWVHYLRITSPYMYMYMRMVFLPLQLSIILTSTVLVSYIKKSMLQWPTFLWLILKSGKRKKQPQ